EFFFAIALIHFLISYSFIGEQSITLDCLLNIFEIFLRTSIFSYSAINTIYEYDAGFDKYSYNLKILCINGNISGLAFKKDWLYVTISLFSLHNTNASEFVITS